MVFQLQSAQLHPVGLISDQLLKREPFAAHKVVTGKHLHV